MLFRSHRKTIKSQKAKKHTAFAVCFRLSLSVKSNLYMKRLEGLSPNFYREAPDNFNAALQNQHCVNRRNLTVSVYIAEDFLLVGKLDRSNRCFKGSKGVVGGYLAGRYGLTFFFFVKFRRV